jgi:hypothetical protein
MQGIVDWLKKLGMSECARRFETMTLMPAFDPN